MKLKVLITFLVFIALCAYESFAQPRSICPNNVGFLCGRGSTPVYAKVTNSRVCERYDSQCLVDQINCYRFRSGEPLLELCEYVNGPSEIYGNVDKYLWG